MLNQDLLSVLVVEDNPGDRRLTEIALQDGVVSGFKSCATQGVGDVHGALEVLRGDTFHPDIILLDLGLPDANGFDGLQAIRDVAPSVPTIVLTGLSDLATATAALQIGASDYLEKAEMGAKVLWRAIRYALERKKNETALIHLANTDPLTGLLNRRALFDQLSAVLLQTRRNELHCAAIVFDIDGFKNVNDLYGHHIGDRLLKEVAAKVSGCVRKTDIVARIGGDEFAVIALNLKSPNGVIEIAEKIRTAIATIKHLDGYEVQPETSIGIAFSPSDDIGAELLVSHADLAMYRSKRFDGSAKIHFFDDAMDHELKARFHLKKIIVDDLDRGKFYLEYQPIVDARSRSIVGTEALARWRGPDDKVISPGEFIPIAEQSGWITLLGQRLLERACRELKNAVAEGISIVPVYLNVSPIQCRDEYFGIRTIETIRSYGINPQMINVEVTESTLMENVKTARRNLEELKDVGIRVHIDDFGTGYSSLSILKDLPLDGLKIDRSFIADMARDEGSARIVQAIAELSRALGYQTVAEGVEVEQQVDPLREVGIDCLQGYYFSRPVSTEIFLDLLKANGPAIERPRLAVNARVTA